MTVLPAAESAHCSLIGIVAGLFVFWLLFAAWARRRLHTPESPCALSNYVRRVIVGMGGIYAIAVLLFTLG
jgi:hypothetical protein